MKINQFDPKDLLTIPNIITYFRILCVPAFIVMSVLAGKQSNETFIYIALGIFVVAAASDLVDGMLARKFNWGSGVGMLLDPLADKLMHISMAICLCFAIKLDGVTFLGCEYYLHWGFLIAIAAKEIIMIILAPIVAKSGAVVKANMIGKVASATLSIGFIMCFFHKYLAPYGAWDWAVIAVAILQSYFAFGSYVIDITKQLIPIVKEKKAAKLGVEVNGTAECGDVADKAKTEEKTTEGKISEDKTENN
ncbi:MAG: CDP-alcohol phosphatidyltransferase family protein [Eubacteriales bacterium]|nr:CDP-alcohol phosphatidyltransferase family protein [Eubacteriales bacterium]